MDLLEDARVLLLAGDMLGDGHRDRQLEQRPQHREPGRGRDQASQRARWTPREAGPWRRTASDTRGQTAGGRADGIPRSSRMAAPASTSSNAVTQVQPLQDLRVGAAETAPAADWSRISQHRRSRTSRQHQSHTLPGRDLRLHPGARPRRGGSSPSGSRPARRQQPATRLLEFHMSPSTEVVPPPGERGHSGHLGQQPDATTALVSKALRTRQCPGHVRDPAHPASSGLRTGRPQPAERNEPYRPYDDHAPGGIVLAPDRGHLDHVARAVVAQLPSASGTAAGGRGGRARRTAARTARPQRGTTRPPAPKGSQ